MSTIQFSSVRKTFGDVTAVDRLDLAVGNGEFVVFVGPSGCGKTTSLRMLAGLDEVSSGSIFIDDRDITWAPPRDRDMAMVFQSYALYPHMTVAENISFALTLRRMGRREIAERVQRAADMLDIGHLLQRRPKELSGGQRQRVAVCRAIVRDPKVFLFDEPLSNLDPQLRTSARGEIRALQRRLGVTSVYVTHDQIEAMTMADRIVVMRDGKVQQIGTPVEVFERPANIFVAGFIGSPPMNILYLAALKNGICAYFGAHIGTENGAGIALGLRPEHLTFRSVGTDAPTVRITQVEMIGYECLVSAEISHQRIIVRVERGLAPDVGETVGLSWLEHEMHFFDASSGLRMEQNTALST
jgi:multiple sugar transport system ATP-binding protein